ncbi:MAG: nuclear transport factor 2 family protein, partial [bacterium]|nr:nuclear transport factor 2 family protein [bacterium]
MTRTGACLMVLIAALPLRAAAAPPEHAAVAEVHAVVDAFHRAAAQADEEGYFALLAPAAVFLGTDAGERWP